MAGDAGSHRVFTHIPEVLALPIEMERIGERESETPSEMNLKDHKNAI
jgi:hypothetical protein